MGITIRSSYSLSATKVCNCRLCGKPFTDRASIDVSSSIALDDLQAFIEREFKRKIPDIPVGWSCNGRDKSGLIIVHCDEHKGGS